MGYKPAAVILRSAFRDEESHPRSRARIITTQTRTPTASEIFYWLRSFAALRMTAKTEIGVADCLTSRVSAANLFRPSVGYRDSSSRRRVLPRLPAQLCDLCNAWWLLRLHARGLQGRLT